MTPIRRDLRVEFRGLDLALIAVMCLGVGLRLAYFTGLAFSDDPDYAARAFNLLKGREYLYLDNNGLRIGTWGPAALGYALFGVTNIGLVCYPLLMSVGAMFVIARLGTRLFDKQTGLVAALLLAFYPLDVELATRLLPDALLAAWSLFAVAMLLTADCAQESEPASTRSVKPWLYFFSGAAFGWCTTINLSSIALFVFLGCYLLGTIRSARTPAAYGLLLAGLLAVVLPESVLYRARFGSLLAKYASTLSHYTLEGRSFFQDLWFYPENMFFVHRGWHVQMPPAQYRPYGFFFLAAVPSTIYGLIAGGRRFRIVALWLVSIFVYLQWGSMSFTSWTLLHRLDRHLELVTPALILALAFACRRLAARRFGLAASAVAVVALFTTSVTTIQRRHAETMEHLSPMQAVHSVLEVNQPSHVFMETQTIAYQRFLDRFEERGRMYHDIARLETEMTDAENLVVIHSEQTLPGRINPLSLPAEWRLATSINVQGPSGIARSVRAYTVSPLPLLSLPVDRVAAVEEHLRNVVPGSMTPGSRLVFYWDGIVDGVEEVSIQGTQVSQRHVAFEPAQDVTSRLYESVANDSGEHFDIIKERGRGTVKAIVPSDKTNASLVIEVNDAAPGPGRYRWFVVARPDTRPLSERKND